MSELTGPMLENAAQVLLREANRTEPLREAARVLQEVGSLTGKVEEAEKRIRGVKAIEEEIRAKYAADGDLLVDNARRTAESIVKGAEKKAEEIRQEAENDASTARTRAIADADRRVRETDEAVEARSHRLDGEIAEKQKRVLELENAALALEERIERAEVKLTELRKEVG